MPLIEDVLELQGSERIWTVLDMKHGFHQIPVREGHREYTAFHSPQGLMQWKVMPMGITNGNSIFQRQMEWVLRGLPFAVAYVDDILTGSDGDTEEELLANHAKHVRMVLDRLAEYQLVA